MTRKRRLRMIALAFLLAAVAAIVWQWRAARHDLAQSFSRPPTPYTELYFTDYSQLPRSLSLSEQNHISFTITNHEGKAMVYSYVVTADSPLQAVTVASGRVPLGTDHFTTETVTFSPRQPATRYRLSIRLSAPRRPLTIAFTATS